MVHDILETGLRIADYVYLYRIISYHINEKSIAQSLSISSAEMSLRAFRTLFLQARAITGLGFRTFLVELELVLKFDLPGIASKGSWSESEPLSSSIADCTAAKPSAQLGHSKS